MDKALINWAIEQADIGLGAKLTLVVLVCRADDARQVIVPARDLMKVTQQSSDTVRRNLKELESAGLIARSAQYDDFGGRLADIIQIIVAT